MIESSVMKTFATRNESPEIDFDHRNISVTIANAFRCDWNVHFHTNRFLYSWLSNTEWIKWFKSNANPRYIYSSRKLCIAQTSNSDIYM